MLRRCAIHGFLLVALTAGLRAEVPAMIESVDGKEPIWVSVDAAHNGEGSFRWELIKPTMRPELEQILSTNRRLRREQAKTATAESRTCQTVRVGTSGIDLPDTSFKSFIDYSKVAFTGTIRDIEMGFLAGQTASLLEVDVERVLKKPLSVPELVTVYVAFAGAVVGVEGEMLCSRSSHYPAHPAKGRKILVFAERLDETDPLVAIPHSSAVLFEREDGTISIPWEQGAYVDGGPTWSTVTRQLDQLGSTHQTRPDLNGKENLR